MQPGQTAERMNAHMRPWDAEEEPIMKKYLVTFLLAGVLSLAGTVPTAHAASETTYTCTMVSEDGSVVVLTGLSKEEAQAVEQASHSQGYKAKCEKEQ
jgi:hypothetical protein